MSEVVYWLRISVYAVAFAILVYYTGANVVWTYKHWGDKK
jgi:hypothetical protein